MKLVVATAGICILALAVSVPFIYPFPKVSVDENSALRFMSANYEIRNEAAWELSQKGPEGSTIAVQFLDSSKIAHLPCHLEQAIILNAMIVLTAIGGEAVWDLQCALENSNDMKVARAAYVLGAIGSPARSALPDLETVLYTHHTRFVRYYALIAIERIVGVRATLVKGGAL